MPNNRSPDERPESPSAPPLRNDPSATFLLAHLMPRCSAAIQRRGASVACLGDLLPATAAAILQGVTR
jgi:hypothetical protein